MLLLTRQEVESLLSMEAALIVVEAGFRRLAAGQVVMPQRAATEIAPHHGLHLSMPAFVAGDEPGQAAPVDTNADPGALMIKIVTVYGENPARYGLPTIQGLLLFHDARTGAPLALMDAEALTAIRTGAGGGVAAKYMARPDAQVLTIFGAGAQAAAQVEAVCAVRPIRQVYVVTKTGRQDADFCAQLAQRLGVTATPAATLDRHTERAASSGSGLGASAAAMRAAVEAADVICTATNSVTPLFAADWVQPGTHINAIGAYKRSMREIDAPLVRRSRVIVDRHEAAQTEAGDILLAVEEGVIGYDHVAGELGQVVSGALPGRTADAEVTLFKSVGLAMQDAVTAAYVVAQAQAQGVGTEITL